MSMSCLGCFEPLHVLDPPVKILQIKKVVDLLSPIWSLILAFGGSKLYNDQTSSCRNTGDLLCTHKRQELSRVHTQDFLESHTKPLVHTQECLLSLFCARKRSLACAQEIYNVHPMDPILVCAQTSLCTQENLWCAHKKLIVCTQEGLLCTYKRSLVLVCAQEISGRGSAACTQEDLCRFWATASSAPLCTSG